MRCLGIDLPSASWSQSRRAPPWSKFPKRLRDAKNIYGNTDLSESDRHKVNSGNTQLRMTLKLIGRCNSLKIPGYVENPAASMLWQVPAIKRRIAERKLKLNMHNVGKSDLQHKRPLIFATFGGGASTDLKVPTVSIDTVPYTGTVTDNRDTYPAELGRTLARTLLSSH